MGPHLTVEQRYQAVLAVLSGSSVLDVAARFAVSRQSVHWLAAYPDEELVGLETRSRRPDSSPWQAEPAVEAGGALRDVELRQRAYWRPQVTFEHYPFTDAAISTAHRRRQWPRDHRFQRIRRGGGCEGSTQPRSSTSTRCRTAEA